MACGQEADAQKVPACYVPTHKPYTVTDPGSDALPSWLKESMVKCREYLHRYTYKGTLIPYLFSLDLSLILPLLACPSNTIVTQPRLRRLAFQFQSLADLEP